MPKMPAKSAVPPTVDAYFAALTPEQRSALGVLRRAILSVVPRATEAVSYRMPMVKYKGRYLVGYAACRSHCSLFALGYATLKAHRTLVKDYVASKGTVRFALDKPVPVTLVRRLVRARKVEVDAILRKPKKPAGRYA